MIPIARKSTWFFSLAALWLAACAKQSAEAPPSPETTATQEADREEEKALNMVAKPAAAPMEMAKMKKEAKDDMAPGAIGGKDEDGKEGQKGKGGAKTETWKRSTLVANTSRLMIGDREELPIKGMQIHAQVDGFRARVLIDFYFLNDRDQQFEGTFKLRLPEGASPYFLAFGQTAYKAPEGNPQYEMVQVAGKRRFEPEAILDQRKAAWIEPKVARMVPKEKAAYAYKETVRRRVDPALMEWSGSGIFSARIFPITPQKLHRVVVAYDMDLTRAGADLEFLLPLPPELPSSVVDIDAALPRGVKFEVEPEASPRLQDGRAQVRYRNPSTRAIRVRLAGFGDSVLTGEDPKTGPYFAARLSPELSKAPVSGRAGTAVFLVDVSLSSNPDGFNVWLKLLQAILDNNRKSIRKFAVLFFNVESFWYRERLTDNTPAEVDALIKYAKTLALEGATDLSAALGEAVRPGWVGQRAARFDLFLLGDGAVTWGEGDQHALSSLLQKGGVDALYAYRTGMAGGDARMLEHLARESGGAIFSVVGEAEIAEASQAHTRRPWRIRKVEVTGGSDLVLAGRPRFLFPGQRMTLAGRGRLKPGAKVLLRLDQGGPEQVVQVRLGRAVESELAPRVYGQIAVGQLEDFLEATEEPAGAYARHFRVTGRSTSLLMLESEEDYLRFDIKPQDDARVIREKTVGILLANALDQLAQRLGDAKAGFLAWIAKLQEIPGVELRLGPEVSRLLAAIPRQAFEVSVPRLTCKQHAFQDIPGNLQELLVQRKPTYDAISAEALRRKKKYGSEDALKALSSLVEVSPGDGVLARDIGFTAMEWGLHAHAYHLFRRVVQSRPFEPQTYRALALSLADQGKPDLALAYFELGMTGQWDGRFGEFRKILMLDYLRFLSRASKLHPSSRSFAQKRLGDLRRELAIERADLLVTITWNTDNTDVDLHVIEPSGEECYYSHPNTASGGNLTQDVTQGYGPEMYILPKAPGGKYVIKAKYFASDSARASARTKVYATVYRGWGTQREKVTRKVVTLEYGKEMHDIAVVKLP